MRASQAIRNAVFDDLRHNITEKETTLKRVSRQLEKCAKDLAAKSREARELSGSVEKLESLLMLKEEQLSSVRSQVARLENRPDQCSCEGPAPLAQGPGSDIIRSLFRRLASTEKALREKEEAVRRLEHHVKLTTYKEERAANQELELEVHRLTQLLVQHGVSPNAPLIRDKPTIGKVIDQDFTETILPRPTREPRGSWMAKEAVKGSVGAKAAPARDVSFAVPADFMEPDSWPEQEEAKATTRRGPEVAGSPQGARKQGGRRRIYVAGESQSSSGGGPPSSPAQPKPKQKTSGKSRAKRMATLAAQRHRERQRMQAELKKRLDEEEATLRDVKRLRERLRQQVKLAAKERLREERWKEILREEQPETGGDRKKEPRHVELEDEEEEGEPNTPPSGPARDLSSGSTVPSATVLVEPESPPREEHVQRPLSASQPITRAEKSNVAAARKTVSFNDVNDEQPFFKHLPVANMAGDSIGALLQVSPQDEKRHEAPEGGGGRAALYDYDFSMNSSAQSPTSPSVSEDIVGLLSGGSRGGASPDYGSEEGWGCSPGAQGPSSPGEGCDPEVVEEKEVVDAEKLGGESGQAEEAHSPDSRQAGDSRLPRQAGSPPKMERHHTPPPLAIGEGRPEPGMPPSGGSAGGPQSPEPATAGDRATQDAQHVSVVSSPISMSSTSPSVSSQATPLMVHAAPSPGQSGTRPVQREEEEAVVVEVEEKVQKDPNSVSAGTNSSPVQPKVRLAIDPSIVEAKMERREDEEEEEELDLSGLSPGGGEQDQEGENADFFGGDSDSSDLDEDSAEDGEDEDEEDSLGISDSDEDEEMEMH